MPILRLSHFKIVVVASAAALAACAPVLGHGYYDQGGGQSPETRNTAHDKVVDALKFDQKLDSQVPLNATFRDENGRTVTLGSLFNGKPVILVSVFYRCTFLCSEVLNETVRSTKKLNFTAGSEYNVVAISIDHRETPAMAREEKAEWMKKLARPGAEKGWHLLTGTKQEINRVTDSIGFHFTYDRQTDQFAHPNGVVVLTPQGKVTRYFYGVQYNPRDLKFGLMEAAAERIGSPVDQLLLMCFHYDPNNGQYNVLVMGVVRLAGALTMLLLGGGIIIALRREKRRARTMKGPAEAGA